MMSRWIKNSSRDLCYSDTGLCVSIPSYHEEKGLFGITVEFNILVVTSISCFKPNDLKESSVIEFQITKELDDFEELCKCLSKKFSCIVLPEIPSIGISGGQIDSLRVILEKVLQFVASKKCMVLCSTTLEFFGGSPKAVKEYLTDSKLPQNNVVHERQQEKKPRKKVQSGFMFAEMDQEEENLFGVKKKSSCLKKESKVVMNEQQEDKAKLTFMEESFDDIQISSPLVAKDNNDMNNGDLFYEIVDNQCPKDNTTAISHSKETGEMVHDLNSLEFEATQFNKESSSGDHGHNPSYHVITENVEVYEHSSPEISENAQSDENSNGFDKESCSIGYLADNLNSHLITENVEVCEHSSSVEISEKAHSNEISSCFDKESSSIGYLADNPSSHAFTENVEVYEHSSSVEISENAPSDENANYFNNESSSIGYLADTLNSHLITENIEVCEHSSSVEISEKAQSNENSSYFEKESCSIGYLADNPGSHIITENVEVYGHSSPVEISEKAPSDENFNCFDKVSPSIGYLADNPSSHVITENVEVYALSSSSEKNETHGNSNCFEENGDFVIVNDSKEGYYSEENNDFDEDIDQIVPICTENIFSSSIDISNDCIAESENLFLNEQNSHHSDLSNTISSKENINYNEIFESCSAKSLDDINIDSLINEIDNLQSNDIDLSHILESMNGDSSILNVNEQTAKKKEKPILPKKPKLKTKPLASEVLKVHVKSNKEEKENFSSSIERFNEETKQSVIDQAVDSAMISQEMNYNGTDEIIDSCAYNSQNKVNDCCEKTKLEFCNDNESLNSNKDLTNICSENGDQISKLSDEKDMHYSDLFSSSDDDDENVNYAKKDSFDINNNDLLFDDSDSELFIDQKICKSSNFESENNKTNFKSSSFDDMLNENITLSISPQSVDTYILNNDNRSMANIDLFE